MAIPEQCSAYKDCGYVKWRRDRPSEHMEPLPADGDCGKKKPQECPRFIYITSDDEKVRSEINSIYHVENVYTHTLPISSEEMKIAFPLQPRSKEGSKKRLSPGVHR